MVRKTASAKQELPVLTNGTNLVDALPISAAICNALGEGASVLFSVPRYCNAREILLRVPENYRARDPNIKPIVLEGRVLSGQGALDYQFLWECVRKSLHTRNLPKQLRTNDRGSFERGVKLALAQQGDSTLFLLPGLGRGRAKHFYELLQTLHQLNDRSTRFAASDDFSFWFHIRHIKEQSSIDYSYIFDVVRQLPSSGLSAQQLSGFLGKVIPAGLITKSDPHLASQFYELTGGHIGLILALCRDLASQDWVIPENYFVEDGPRLLGQSTVLEGIRRDIQEDVAGIATTALEFRQQNHAVEYASPRYQILRQLGIVDVVGQSEMRLRPGVIQRFIEDAASATPPNRLGTVVSPTGVTRFENRELMLNNNDIVVLHLSDLHVGKDHAFRISYQGGILNEGVESLAGLLRQDLRRLNLLARVDAIVISGDIVCTASYDEFVRAADVISDIGRECEINLSQMLIVPGNHDIQWGPNELAATSGGRRNVSREGFETFLKLLDNRKFDLCNSMTIDARGGGASLDIVGFDSNFVEGPEAAGIGYVSKDGLKKGGAFIDSRTPGTGKSGRTWVVVHHHVFPVTSADLHRARTHNVSVMGNASELLRYAYQWGAELILHGHEHQPVVTWAQRWVGEASSLGFRPLAVLGAGSCGAKRELLGPMARNQYYVIVRKESEIIVRSRVLGEEGVNFVPHQDFAISVKPEGLGHERLGEAG